MAAAVVEDLVAEGGEVQVVVDEQLVGRNVVEQLDQRAGRTEGDVEREPRLRQVEVLGTQQGVGERQLPE